MKEIVAVAKALSDVNRLRALYALRGRELCLCQLVDLLALATSTVSRHMAVLQQAGLVRSRKQGRWAYFRLACDTSPPVAGILQAVFQALRDAPLIARDSDRLDEILQIDPEELCRRRETCQ